MNQPSLNKLIDEYQQFFGGDTERAVSILLGHIRHYCDERGIEYAAAEHIGLRRVYLPEKQIASPVTPRR